jgi:hypothetical protein
MNKLILISSAFAFLVANLSGKDLLPKFTIERSESVFMGKFDAEDIKFIALIPSNQKSIYPIPKLDTNSKIRVATNRKFIMEFSQSIINTGASREILSENFIRSYHLLVVFLNGDSACLHGAIHGKNFSIQPLFESDSISASRNNVYNRMAHI